LKHKQGLN